MFVDANWTWREIDREPRVVNKLLLESGKLETVAAIDNSFVVDRRQYKEKGEAERENIIYIDIATKPNQTSGSSIIRHTNKLEELWPGKNWSTN